MYYQNSKIMIDKLPGEPIVLVTVMEGYDFGNDMIESNKPSFELLDSQPEPVYWVLDMRQAKLGFEQLLSSSSAMTRGEKPLWHHPKIRQTVVVTDAGMIKLAVKGLSSDAFGGLAVKAFGTVEEALDYARSNP